MSYGRGNITMVQDLPDLHELEGLGDYHEANPQIQLPQGNYQFHEDNIQREQIDPRKAIRPTQQLYPESGMVPRRTPIEALGGYAPNGAPNGVPNGMAPNGMVPNGVPHGMVPNGMAPNGVPHGGHVEQFVHVPFVRPPGNCLDIAEHIQSCPLCSKFYGCDKTVYLVTIGILVIICILLLKKVLDT